MNAFFADIIRGVEI